MWFLPGIHIVDTTIAYGPNCRYVGISGEVRAGELSERPILRLNPDPSAKRDHMHLFAPDPAYLSTSGPNRWTRGKSSGFVSNVVIENLRLDVRIGGKAGEIQESVPLAAVFLAGTAGSRIVNNRILNYLFGVVVTANECDSLFYAKDSDWTTKGWYNEVHGNEIANGAWRKSWAAGARDTMALWGGAGIVGVASNGIVIANNSIAFTGGPAIWLPHVSSALVQSNGIENAAPEDTLAPHVVVGYWAGQVSCKSEIVSDVRNPWDSTHVFVNAELEDCASYRNEGKLSHLAARGARSVLLTGNRFELENAHYYPHIYVGPNARSTVIVGNTFSGGSQGVARHNTVVDYGYGTTLRDNAFAHDGPLGRPGTGRAWRSGDKALWHELNSQPEGGVVLLEPITYYLDFSADVPEGCLRARSDLVIQGVPGKTVLRLDDNVDPQRWRDGHGLLFIGNGSANVTIRDIIFDGNAANQKGFETAPQWEAKHLAIGLGELAGKPSDRIENVTIEDCRFEGFVCSIALNSGCNFSGIRIHDNTFLPQTATAGRGVDPATSAIRQGVLEKPFTATGVLVTNNLIIDEGIGRLLGGGRVPAYFPANVRDGGANRLFSSVFKDNFVDVRAPTKAARVDTLWHEETRFRLGPPN
jgi:hypothetical protein